MFDCVSHKLDLLLHAGAAMRQCCGFCFEESVFSKSIAILAACEAGKGRNHAKQLYLV